jgi:hypothetical protein
MQGTGDNFYKQSQLLPENLEKAAKDAGVGGLEVRYQDVSPALPPPLIATIFTLLSLLFSLLWKYQD